MTAVEKPRLRHLSVPRLTTQAETGVGCLNCRHKAQLLQNMDTIDRVLVMSLSSHVTV